jgi:hypothetical protein
VRPSTRALFGVLAGGAAAACSAILSLEPPPPSNPSDAAVAPDAPAEASVYDAGTVPPVCVGLDAGDGGAAYAPLLADAGGAWTFFDTAAVGTRVGQFAGGVFDGRYVYFAPSSNGVVARVDTTSPAAFTQTLGWSSFDTSTLPNDAGGPRAYSGAAFDGRYVYFVPHAALAAYGGVVARFDTTADFTSASSWSTFDMSSLGADGGPSPKGFAGAASDGRYLYFVPSVDDAGPNGRVVRFDSTPVDSGTKDATAAPLLDAALGDAALGDAGAVTVTQSSPFANPSLWSTFDIATTSDAATGFAGAAFDGTSFYFVPFDNGGPVNGGLSSILARYRADAGLAAASSWTSLDMTTVNGEAVSFAGAAYDGHYVYFVPHSRGVALRFDTRSTKFNAQSSWSAYDIGRLAPEAGASLSFYGASFDGRFVYYVPAATGFGTVVRYDTLATFGADCAWSSMDLTQIDPAAAAYTGAVFDGEFVYLVPHGNGVVARFDAKSPGALPALPAFHGSFY